MKKSLKGLTVLFDRDLNEGEADLIVAAVLQLRGVAEVKRVTVVSEDHWARRRVYLDLREKFLKFSVEAFG